MDTQEIWAPLELIAATRAGVEVWSEVVDSDGAYDVSNLGNVRSWLPPGGGKGRLDKPHTIKACPNLDGYPCVGVRKNGKRVYKQVHLLVAESFIGPKPTTEGFWEVGHEDGSKDNNRLDNLKWCTRSVNQNDRDRHGTKHHREIREVAGVKSYRCTRCNTWKPFDQFRKLSPNSESACGRASNCLECARIRGNELKRMSRLRSSAK